MQNPYVAAAARRLLGIASPIKPEPALTDEQVNKQAANEGKAIGIANGGRVKFNRQIDKRGAESRHVVSQ